MVVSDSCGGTLQHRLQDLKFYIELLGRYAGSSKEIILYLGLCGGVVTVEELCDVVALHVVAHCGGNREAARGVLIAVFII